MIRSFVRILGTRFGLAFMLSVIVLLILLVTRVATDRSGSGPVGPVLDVDSPTAILSPSPGDDGRNEPTGQASSLPSLSVDVAEVNSVASSFLAAWLNHKGLTADQWRSGMAPFATATLMAKFKDTDPADVPASRVVGDFRVIDRGTVAEVAVPVNGGAVRLGLLVAGGQWRVDSVDWEPS